MEEWFSLVNEKNLLVRQESDLVYELRDLELIEQHEVLDSEIRKRMAKDGERGQHIVMCLTIQYCDWIITCCLLCSCVNSDLTDSHKSEMEKLEEEAMISELVELVEKRDKLLWTLHLEKTLWEHTHKHTHHTHHTHTNTHTHRDDEEDRQVELMASTQGYSVPQLQRHKSSRY